MWEDGRHHSPTEPPVKEYRRWVEWRGQMVDTPSWWWELEEVPEVEDTQELAQKIWASFELPQWMSEVHEVEDYHLAPPAHKCLCQKDSSHCQIQGSPAETSGRSNRRRPWLTHRLFNIGLKGPICLCQVDHIFWQGLSFNCIR